MNLYTVPLRWQNMSMAGDRFKKKMHAVLFTLTTLANELISFIVL